jgi:hypothetical protein
MDKLNVLYTDPGQFGSQDAGVIGIILTIFAIGTQYAYLDSPGNIAAGKPGPGFSEDELGTRFYQEAIRLLPEIIESSSLESVQACLLFAAYSLPIDAAGLGYIYLNLAVRLAIQNGMHRKYTGDAFSPAMIEIRNRVWWTAYTMERYVNEQRPAKEEDGLSVSRKISIFHGRPLAMLRSDIDSHLPSDQEDIQLGNCTWTVHNLVASVYLSQRLEEFFDEM